MIDYIVTAVKEREDHVNYLRKHIPNLIVVWDKWKDPMETFMRAWGEYPVRPSIRLQDDVVLTKNFCEKVENVIRQHPNDVIQFFSRRKKDIEVGTRWETPSGYLNNQCHYLPKGMAGRIFDFGLTWEYIEEHPTADDLLMRHFFTEKGIRYLLHVPSLVEHAKVASAIDPRRSWHRQSVTFKDPEIEGLPNKEQFNG